MPDYLNLENSYQFSVYPKKELVLVRGKNATVWDDRGNAYIDCVSGQLIAPQNPNAGVFKVVPDDPGKPHTASRPSGVFNLTAGSYRIDLCHYAKIANLYPQFINGAISGPESVKILGFRLEYLGE